jgi:hypothetical protein
MDDELEAETRPFVQGAPVGSRAEEIFVKEEPGEDDPMPEDRVSGDRGSESPMLR